MTTGRVPSRRAGRGRRVFGFGALSVALLLAGQVTNPSPAYAATATVALGTAESFSALSGSGVTSTGSTSLSGDLGASTEISIVGFPPGIVGGQTYVGDPTVPLALADLQLAYNDAAGRTANVAIAGDLNGLTFLPGVYHAGAALAITGTATLDGAGDSNAVFIFQVGAAFNTAASSSVDLINGAHASNVFWQVVGATGIGANASFSGTIMAGGAITIGASATLDGRALSTGGTITLSSNTINTPPIVTITGGATVFTDATTPTITGTADAPAGTTVTVTVAGQTIATTISASGTWTVTAATLVNGTYRVGASIVGPAGNKGTARQSLTVGPPTPVALGRAESFSALSGSGVTSTGSTFLSGDLGASTAVSIVGFPPGVVGGQTYIGAPTVPTALDDLQLAYNDAATRAATNAGIAGDLNGLTFLPGVYHAGAALAITGTVTLDGGGDSNAVFIFQVGAAFGTAASSKVNLINSADPSNVFWQVVGATDVGANASFSGTIMAGGAITIGASATLDGRALSTGGAITLSSNTVTTPSVTGGTLSISVPTGAVSLGTFANVSGGQTIGGPLGTVTIDDTRGGSTDRGWVASVVSTSFTSAAASIPASAVSYSAGTVAQIRGAVSYTLQQPQPTDLTSPVSTVTASGASGDNAAMTMWNPTISILIPPGSSAGVYAGTITQSVL